MRILLLILVNISIMLTLAVIAAIFGINPGTGKNLNIASLVIFSGLFGFGGAFISLLLSKPMAKWSTGATLVETNTPLGSWLYRVVDEQAKKQGINTPEVYIYDAPEPNAFATGAFKNSSMVAVSTGLLNKLSREEVEAVLGHEVGHVASGDMVTMTLLQGTINTFVLVIARLVGWVVDRIILKNESNSPGIAQIATTFVLELILTLVGSLILAWYSRRREFVADRIGAELTSRQHMANALLRLKSDEPSTLPASMMAFGIKGGSSFAELLSTHPPIEQRVDALMNR